MNTFNKIAGPLGLVLIIIGGITYGILYTSIYSMIPLILGLILSVYSVIMNLKLSKTEGAVRSTKLSINAGISILFLAAILIFCQALASRHSARFDTTENKRYSLSSETTNILDGLKDNVTFTCFFKETTRGKRQLEDLLKEYSSKSPHIKYRFIDPDKKPMEAKRYGVTSYGTTVVECRDQEEKIYGTTEEKITNALLKVTRKKKKAIYFVSGHGEKALEDTEPSGLSQLKKAIGDENYEVKELFTMRDTIPEDCSVLVVAGPTKDMFPQEQKMFERYLDKGGKLLAMVDPLSGTHQLDSLISHYGIEVTNSMIIDKLGKLLAGNYLTPVVNSYGEHPITKNFRVASFFPQVRALRKTTNADKNLNIVTLVSTSPSSYAETNVKALLSGKTQFNPNEDMAGPVNIAMVASKQHTGIDVNTGKKKPSSRLVVFGDSDFISNGYLNLSGNKDLILNTINWLAEEEDLIAIRPRNALSQPVILTDKQGRVVFWLPVIGLPALIALLGIMVGVKKHKAA